MNLTVKIQNGEYWWGCSTAEAERCPFDQTSVFDYDMRLGYNQTMPLFISNKGRYIFSTAPMKVHIENGEFSLSSDGEIILKKAGLVWNTHFTFTTKWPPMAYRWQ